MQIDTVEYYIRRDMVTIMKFSVVERSASRVEFRISTKGGFTLCNPVAARAPSVNMKSLMRPLHAAAPHETTACSDVLIGKVIFRATLSLGCMEFVQSQTVTASDV